MIFLITLLSACTDQIPDDTLLAHSTLQAQWPPSAVLAELDTLLSYGIPSPIPVWNSFQQLYNTGATERCPGTNYNFDSPEVETSGCTTDVGYSFFGAAEYRDEQENWDLHCDCRIIKADGTIFEGAGNIGKMEDNGFTWLDIRGSFWDTTSTVTEPWLAEISSMNLQLSFDSVSKISGGYTISNHSVYFANFRLEECEKRSDSIFIRDPSGGWWQWQASNSCTHGQLYFQDEAMGEYMWNSSVLDPIMSQIKQSIQDR